MMVFMSRTNRVSLYNHNCAGVILHNGIAIENCIGLDSSWCSCEVLVRVRVAKLFLDYDSSVILCERLTFRVDFFIFVENVNLHWLLTC